jgi:NitT/TauT family transport system substrate-binding protein
VAGPAARPGGLTIEHARVVEPLRTALHLPHYVAMALGLFAREGLEVALATADGAGGVSRALLAGEAEVGLAEPVRALGLADRGEARLLSVAEVASRAGLHLLARAPTDLDWRDLRGRRVLVPAEPAAARLGLEYLLERHEVSLAAVDLGADLPAARAIEAFVAGRAEFLLLGQPEAEGLVAAGQAHVAASLGAALGPMAASAYLVPPRLLVERGGLVAALLRALARALAWLRDAPATEAAAAAAWAFPGVPPGVLDGAVRRLMGVRVWPADPVPRRPALDALQEMLLLRGVVRRSRPYEELVAAGPAEAAVRALAAEAGRA